MRKCLTEVSEFDLIEITEMWFLTKTTELGQTRNRSRLNSVERSEKSIVLVGTTVCVSIHRIL